MDQSNQPPVQPEAPPVVNVTVAAPVPPPASFGEKLSSGFAYLWKNDKIFLVIFGVLIIAAKFSGLLMDMIAAGSKKDVEKAQSQDAALKSQEDAASKQADDLVQQAKDLPSQEQPVTEDWNKK